MLSSQATDTLASPMRVHVCMCNEASGARRTSLAKAQNERWCQKLCPDHDAMAQGRTRCAPQDVRGAECSEHRALFFGPRGRWSENSAETHAETCADACPPPPAPPRPRPLPHAPILTQASAAQCQSRRPALEGQRHAMSRLARTLRTFRHGSRRLKLPTRQKWTSRMREGSRRGSSVRSRPRVGASATTRTPMNKEEQNFPMCWQAASSDVRTQPKCTESTRPTRGGHQ